MTTLPHACVGLDSRSCYELRYYGHSPAWRDEDDDAFIPDDGDDVCECSCHVPEPDEDTDWID